MALFDKTPRGREEIALRGAVLTPRLRTLLLLVDGKTDSEILLNKVIGLGLTQEHLTVLLGAGLIEPHVSAAVHPNGLTASANVAPSPLTALTPEQAAPTLPTGPAQYEAVYRFYNETIKSMIGLRGYGLQLKVERAASIDDFKEIRQLYLEAVLKSKGKEITRNLRDRLDQLLYLGEPGPDSIKLD